LKAVELKSAAKKEMERSSSDIAASAVSHKWPAFLACTVQRAADRESGR
jgi:hypothetical protein